MRLLISFAFCSDPACAGALAGMHLPNLQRLLRRLSAGTIDSGVTSSLSPPHERALARALNLPLDDGRIPWAAYHAHRQGLVSDAGWAFISPCRWHSGSRALAMSSDPLDDLDELQSRALLATMQPFFTTDSLTLHYDQPTRWLVQGEALRSLKCASLDRVRGCAVADWLPSGDSAIAWQRLQSEMQMLLHEHAVNAGRVARGGTSVNSLWISGSGALPPGWVAPADDQLPQRVHALRAPALRQDWSIWCQTWQQIDRSECAAMLAALQRGANCQLTLCGERSAQTFSTLERAGAGSAAMHRVRQWLRPDTVQGVLSSL